LLDGLKTSDIGKLQSSVVDAIKPEIFKKFDLKHIQVRHVSYVEFNSDEFKSSCSSIGRVQNGFVSNDEFSSNDIA
jgi:hypothetical protein